jgi:tRNA dimethylallyltransferase
VSAPRGLASRVIVLGGPTASGKSALAAALAGAIGGAVVSADSRQVYRGMEIGSAQPGRDQLEQAPHYLVGFLPPTAHYSAGMYGEDARKVITALARRGIPVVLCGGTGLYIRAALTGVPGGGLNGGSRIGESRLNHDRAREAQEDRLRRRAALARRWNTEGAQAMHAALASVDPALASRLHPRDRQRVLRGLEFHETHGQPLSETWNAPLSGSERSLERGRPEARAVASRFRLEIPVADLERAIEERLRRMLEQGFVEEARALFELYGNDPPGSLNAVGYPELFAHFRGEIALDEALAKVRLRTQQYAKRQRTWFRNQDDYLPLRAGDEALPALLAALSATTRETPR